MKFELLTVKRRGRLVKIILAETLVITGISLLAYHGADSTTFASAYDQNFMINANTQTLSMIMIILLPLLSSLASGDLMSSDDEIRNYLIVRKGKMRYRLMKLLAVFLIGFLNSLFIFELFNLYSMAACDLSGRFYIARDFCQLTADGLARYNPLLLERPGLFSQLLFVLFSLFSASAGCLSLVIGEISGRKVLYYFGGFAIIMAVNLTLTLLNEALSYNMAFSCFLENLSGKPLSFHLGIITLWIAVPLIISLTYQLLRAGH